MTPFDATPGDATIAVVGPGRMGTGISQVFAAAGHEVRLLDAKDRDSGGFEQTEASVREDVRTNLDFLAANDQFGGDRDDVLTRIEFETDPTAALSGVDWVFEALPEEPDIKTGFFDRAAKDLPGNAVLATTTSSISLDTLVPAVPDSERLLITHWLNPAFIVPLVEVARADDTDDAAVAATVELLEAVGKEPVVCRDSPGFLGSRIQAAAMNEAVRAWEDGVASAAEIDRALRQGVGFRMAAMGLLEFVDIGGVDILYNVDEYLTGELGERFETPESVREKIAADELGSSTGKGYYDYESVDVGALTDERYRRMLGLLSALDEPDHVADSE
jgi:3-hydroxybutyryl-CoA dehydrogenase